MKRIYLFLASIIMLASCAELQSAAEQILLDTNKPLTSFDVSNGLKEALKVGSVNAASVLSKENGFYNDQLSKILLPPEAQVISKNIKKIPGGSDLVNKVELRLNRAAEDAVKAAAPIFATAISEMTITDAFAILKGGDNAATNYLKSKTATKLRNMFMPKVSESLNKKIVAGMSTNESWNLLTSNYNKLANSIVGSIANMKTVNTSLDKYVTDKALESLFTKVANEEKNIRKNPAARVSNILKKVFAQ